MIRKFVNRKKELEFLEEQYRRLGFSFVILYGRRRVGKTELIKEFIKNKPAIYYLCDKTGTKRNAKRFARITAEFFNDIPPEVENFDEVFEYIVKRCKSIKDKLVVAVDEYPYLVEKDKQITSVFQRIVDEILKNTDLMLILCGSSMSIMYNETLSSKSPLYGRRTGFWEVTPFKFRDILKFFPNKNVEDVIKIYSVFGDIPAYLSFVDENLPLEENIIEKIMRKGSPLYREPEILLREELRDPSTYERILWAMTKAETFSEIASLSEVPEKDLPKYLKKLMDLRIVEKIDPIIGRKKKKSLYRINDNLFYFWFKFCKENISYLEEGDEQYVFNKFVRKELDKLFSRAFENVSRQFVKEYFKLGNVGTWWGFVREGKERKRIELDIVSIGEKIYVGEVKWGKNIDARRILKDLKKKIEFTEISNYVPIIIARGFKRKCGEAFCFDIKDMENFWRFNHRSVFINNRI